MRTPLVIAMWEPMARALGWPKKPLGFADILRLADDPRGWAAAGTRVRPVPVRAHEPGLLDVRRSRRSSASTTPSPASRRACARPRSRAPRPRRDGEADRALDRPLRRLHAVHRGPAVQGAARATRPRRRWRRSTVIDFNRRHCSGRPSSWRCTRRRARSTQRLARTSSSTRRGCGSEQRTAADVFQRFLAREITPEKAGAAASAPATRPRGRRAWSRPPVRRRPGAAQAHAHAPDAARW